MAAASSHAEAMLMKPSNPHYPFLLLIPLLILVHFPPPALSLSFHYPSMSNSAAKYLNAKGNVSFTPDYVELTWFQNDPSQSVGRVYHQDQLFLWDSATQEAASFNCSFTFSILRNSNMPADGLAFFLLDPSLSELQEGVKGSWLGLLNATTNGTKSAGVVAVEFDTFLNKFDPSDNHVGIDVDSIVSVSYSNLSFGLPDTSSVFAWVDYSSSATLLEVYATNLSSIKPPSPLISYSINLAEFLPEYVRIGFSAATGTASEYHRILSWSFNSTSIGLLMAPGPAPDQAWIPSTINKRSKVGLIAGLVTAGMIFAVAIVVIGMLIWRRKRRLRERRRRSDGLEPSGIELSESRLSPPDVGYGPPPDVGPRKFSYKELSKATNQFGDNFVLGQGGFGSVYKGVLPSDGSEVAVKSISQKSAQGEKEFFAEVSIISRIRHKNLVQLKGWCKDRSNLLLVYEYLPNGSLDHYIFRKSSSCILSWCKRYNIVCGLGSALQYLHQGCEKVIVHRDIKASNVMLDANYNAKLGDFGLARQVGEGMEGHTTLPAGTPGYMAPETHRTGRATTESDVYSYGIVLLEVVCGRRPVDASLPGQFEACLLDWVWDLHSKGALKAAADARLEGAFDEEQLVRTLQVGLACAHPNPRSRPPIHLALEALCGRVNSPLITIPTFNPIMQAYNYGPDPPEYKSISLAVSTSCTISSSSSCQPISSSSSAPDTDMPEKVLLPH